MTPGPHRRYNLEFKLRVVKAADERRGSLKSIARKFDVSHSLVLFWLAKYRQGELTEEDNLLEKLRAYETRVGELERKVGQLTMEIDRLRLPPTVSPAEHGRSEAPEIRSDQNQHDET